MIASPRPKKPPIDWLHIGSLLFAWIFVFGALAVLVYMVHRVPKEPRLVCDRSARAVLNKFGTCHYEN
jgi:hypothetical protein